MGLMRQDLFQSITFPSLVIVIAFAGTMPLLVHAQDSVAPPDTTPVYIARVVVTNVVSESFSGGANNTAQNYDEIVTARILNGTDKGTTIQLETSGTVGDGGEMSQGDTMYVTRFPSVSSTTSSNPYTYESVDHYRIPVIIFFVLLFLVCIIFIGGKQGMRGLVTLAGIIFLIAFVLLPGVLHGYSPILLSIIIACLIASIGAYITHGFSKMTTSAVLGMIATIIGVTILADIAVHLANLSGITDETTFNLLSISGYGDVNFQALLLGGIIIGFLGVLYDAAIGQAVAVEELVAVAPHLPRSVIYRRAFRIGREHIGALVNTLILAYVGVSLPVLLTYSGYSLFSSQYNAPVINQQFIVAEILRMTIGGIGLVLTIPITTFIAVWMLMSEHSGTNPKVLREEQEKIDHIVHHH